MSVIQCPACNTVYEVSQDMHGKNVTCNVCKSPFVVDLNACASCPPPLPEEAMPKSRSGVPLMTTCRMCQAAIPMAAMQCRYCGMAVDNFIRGGLTQADVINAQYSDFRWYRRNGWASAMVLSGLVLGIPMIAACVVVLTGPVYYKKVDEYGDFKQWSVANKAVAVILLFIWLSVLFGDTLGEILGSYGMTE